MSSFPGGPFPAPGFTPQDGAGAAVGSVGNRVGILERVVIPEPFTPDRPFAYGTGVDLNVPDGLPFVSVLYYTLTPLGSVFYDPTVFSGDSSDDLYLNAAGVYLIHVSAGLSNASGDSPGGDSTFKGPVWLQISTAPTSVGVGVGNPTYADNTGVYNTWAVTETSLLYVVEADLPARVDVTFGHYLVNTGPGPGIGVGDPIDVNIQWSLMAAYLDGFSPDEP